MKAVSLWQPHASLVAVGAKALETRNWATNYRGPLAIHAAKRWTPDQRSLLSHWEFQMGLSPLAGKPLDMTKHCWYGIKEEHLPFGAVIAICALADCIPTEKLILGQIWLERCFGDFTPGRFAWVLDNVQWLAQPIPAIGKQGLWDWDERGFAA